MQRRYIVHSTTLFTSCCLLSFMLRCRFQAVSWPAPSGLPRTFPVLALKVPHPGNALSFGMVGHPTAGNSLQITMTSERYQESLRGSWLQWAEQTGPILWWHSAKCLCSSTFPGLCFCPVVQDVNHYQVLIPSGRKTKSESSKGVNEKLHVLLCFYPILFTRTNFCG